MIENKINKKYSPLIWLACFLSGFVANIYALYTNCVYLSSVEISRADLLQNILTMISSYGIMPMLITFFLAYIAYVSAFRRFVRFISRNDFCLLVMITKAIAGALTGFLDVFSFLESGVTTFTTTLAPVVIEFSLMTLLFFLVFCKKYKPNPNEKVRAFLSWGIVYMVLLGIEVVSYNALILFASNPNYAQLVIEVISEMGINPIDILGDFTNSIQVAVSSAALAIFALEVVAFIVVYFILQKGAKDFRDPSTREDYMAKHYNPYGYKVREDVENTFEEFGGKEQVFDDFGNDYNNSNNKNNKDNVFDEFDI